MLQTHQSDATRTFDNEMYFSRARRLKRSAFAAKQQAALEGSDRQEAKKNGVKTAITTRVITNL